MPNLTIAIFNNAIVKTNGNAPVAQSLGPNGAYKRYNLTHVVPAAHSRCNHNVEPVNALGYVAGPNEPISSLRVVCANAANGDSFYLPFNNNEIHSVALPRTPGVNDVRYVFTVGLSGCAIFVDDDPHNNVIYFHHANCIGGPYNVPNPNQQPPSTQTPAAIAKLTTLHQNALAAFGWHTHVQPLASLFKSRYYAELDNKWRRKRSQFRTNVEGWAGTTAWGLYNGNRWEFYYQTYASLTYSRPWYAPKGWLSGRNVNIMNKKPDELIDVQRFYP